MKQIDTHTFYNSDTSLLAQLIEERDHILDNLEVAEARYIASFRLSTPEPSVAELPVPPDPEDENSIKRQISRPRALASYSVCSKVPGVIFFSYELLAHTASTGAATCRLFAEHTNILCCSVTVL